MPKAKEVIVNNLEIRELIMEDLKEEQEDHQYQIYLNLMEGEKINERICNKDIR